MAERVLRIAGIERVGPDAIAVGLDPPPGFEARPGQFVKLTGIVDGEEVSRYFSLSSPDPTERLEVTVAVEPDGTLGPWLADRRAGDTVAVDGPYGDVFYAGESSAVLLAGGPGIGAATAIAARALADGGQAAVVYLDTDPIHERRLARLAAGGAHVVVTSTADAFAGGVRETLTTDGQVFVYGFPDFLETAMAAIEAAGGDPDRAKVENFG